MVGPRTSSLSPPFCRYITGLSVVSQTLCRMDVLPAFALPIMRTRNRMFGTRRRGCWVNIGATMCGKARGQRVDRFDPVLDRWFTRSVRFTFRTRAYNCRTRASQRLYCVVKSVLHDIPEAVCRHHTRSVCPSHHWFLPADCILCIISLPEMLYLYLEHIHRCIEYLGRTYNLRILLVILSSSCVAFTLV